MTFFAGLFSERVHYIVFSVFLKCGRCSFTCVCGEAIEFTSLTCKVKIQLCYNYLVTYFAGIFYMCAYRMHECRRVAGPRWTGTEVPWVERFPNAIQMQSICCQIIKSGTLLKPFLLTLTNKIFLLLDREQSLKKEVEQGKSMHCKKYLAAKHRGQSTKYVKANSIILNFDHFMVTLSSNSVPFSFPRWGFIFCVLQHSFPPTTFNFVSQQKKKECNCVACQWDSKKTWF